jgi:alpha-D-ribose 1-methylphosphonate 5-triphosphate synthase subunit PhnH
MRKVLLSALISACILTPTIAAQGTATGTLKVAGKAVPLTHAYAITRPDPFDKAKEAVLLVLSDAALTPAQLADPFALQALMKANKLHAVSAIIQESNAIASTMLYDSAFKFDSVSVAGTNNKLDVQTFDRTTIAGKLYTQKADDFANVPYEFSATFSAPIQRTAAKP